MRRLTIGFALVCTLLLVESVAGAVPPGFCDPAAGHDDHPHCTATTQPPSTTTTEPTDPPAVEACLSENVIDAVKGTNAFNCEWTPTEPDYVDDSTVGTVTVTVGNGEIGGLVIFVLDSMPGNVCVLEEINKPTEFESASFNLVEGTDTYWNTDSADWCAQYDEFGPKEDLNGPPLHVRVFFRAKGETPVTISLTPEQVVVSE